MNHIGNLTITEENAHKYEALTSVEGNLIIYAAAKLDALTSVGGSIYIRAAAKLDALTFVGGNPLPTKDVAELNLRKIAPIALANGNLKMDIWHCGTSRCIAGHAQFEILGGKIDGCTASIDGTRLLGLEATRHFHVSDEKAREFLQEYI